MKISQTTNTIDTFDEMEYSIENFFYLSLIQNADYVKILASLNFDRDIWSLTLNTIHIKSVNSQIFFKCDSDKEIIK